MKYVDFDLDLSAEHIILDKEITLKRLNWEAGDHFEVTEEDGQIVLTKVDPVVKFARGYE